MVLVYLTTPQSCGVERDSLRRVGWNLGYEKIACVSIGSLYHSDIPIPMRDLLLSITPDYDDML